MLRTIFMIGLFALAGLFVLKLAFGLFGVLFGLLTWLLIKAIWIAVIGAALYLVIRIVSPSTARKLRERWSGTSAV
jgi:type IV secretory pathway VirB3-like protein